MAGKITIKVNGLPEALANFKRYGLKTREGVKNELTIGALKIETLAKQTAPFETGRLSGSITTDLRDIALLVAKVGTDVKYAPYQEFGTRVMAAQPYLYPSFFAYENEIVKAIGKILRRELGLK